MPGSKRNGNGHAVSRLVERLIERDPELAEIAAADPTFLARFERTYLALLRRALTEVVIEAERCGVIGNATSRPHSLHLKPRSAGASMTAVALLAALRGDRIKRQRLTLQPTKRRGRKH